MSAFCCITVELVESQTCQVTFTVGASFKPVPNIHGQILWIKSGYLQYMNSSIYCNPISKLFYMALGLTDW